MGIAPLSGGEFQELEALVDTGSSYTLVPRPLLERLGVVPQENWPFTLADGRRVEYPVTQVRVRLDGRIRYTVCVFGEEGSQPLLGAVTLEEFGLGVDPIGKRLVPIPGLLMTCLP
ncbi:MAG: aspartyl protease family protein [Chloroflexi bacterium]|nr:aspartyl protease family protein [Chloroflexota bacterium]